MKQILVIEDEKNIRENICELLELNDFKVVGAENGVQGIQLALNNQPDLVLSDIMMPNMDGYEVLRTFRRTGNLQNIPFVFLTAKAESSNIREGMNLGADDYLTKPFTSKDLVSSITSRLEKQIKLKSNLKEQIDTYKTNVAKNYSHEINTPLNGILGFVDLLISNFDDFNKEEIIEILESVKDSGLRLHRFGKKIIMMNDILRNENNEHEYPLGKIENYSNTTNLLLEQIARFYEREKDLSVFLAETPLAITKEEFEMIVQEVTHNAFTFSDESEKVVVTSKVEGDYLKLTVSDSGNGFKNPEKYLNESFAKFHENRNFVEGIGLGLFITKKICDLNKCEICINSELNIGTNVNILIPTY